METDAVPPSSDSSGGGLSAAWIAIIVIVVVVIIAAIVVVIIVFFLFWNNEITCSSDNHCPTGQRCNGGICTDNVCRLNSQCPVGQVCRRGQCVNRTCTSSNQCPTGTICSGGVCVPNTCVNGVCPPGYRCSGGICVAEILDAKVVAGAAVVPPATTIEIQQATIDINGIPSGNNPPAGVSSAQQASVAFSNPPVNPSINPPAPEMRQANQPFLPSPEMRVAQDQELCDGNIYATEYGPNGRRAYYPREYDQDIIPNDSATQYPRVIDDLTSRYPQREYGAMNESYEDVDDYDQFSSRRNLYRTSDPSPRYQDTSVDGGDPEGYGTLYSDESDFEDNLRRQEYNDSEDDNYSDNSAEDNYDREDPDIYERRAYDIDSNDSNGSSGNCGADNLHEESTLLDSRFNDYMDNYGTLDLSDEDSDSTEVINEGTEYARREAPQPLEGSDNSPSGYGTSSGDSRYSDYGSDSGGASQYRRNPFDSDSGSCSGSRGSCSESRESSTLEDMYREDRRVNWNPLVNCDDYTLRSLSNRGDSEGISVNQVDVNNLVGVESIGDPINSFFINSNLLYVLEGGRIYAPMTDKIIARICNIPDQVVGFKSMIIGLKNGRLIAGMYNRDGELLPYLNITGIEHLSATYDGTHLWIQRTNGMGYLYDINLKVISESLIHPSTIINYGATSSIYGTLDQITHVLTLSTGQTHLNVKDFVIAPDGSVKLITMNDPASKIILILDPEGNYIGFKIIP